MKLPVHYCAVSLLIGICSALPIGREFATSFMLNFNNYIPDARFMIDVSALPTSQGSTKVTVTALGQVYVQEIDPGKGVSFKLPPGVEMSGSGRFQKTVVIEASQDVTVLSLNYKKATADTSVVYPVREWGTEYIVFTPPSDLWTTFKEFSITNYKDRNFAEVSLRGSVKFQGKHYKRGSKLLIQLEPFESVQIQSKEDLSGTKVVSKQPVAVSSGHSCAEKYTSCSHVYEQLLPIESWGSEFIVAPLPYHNRWSNHDSVYIQASQATKVTKTVAGKEYSFSMYAGQTVPLPSESHSIHLTSDKGIQVLFEFNGGFEDVIRPFGPFLMTILPTDRFSVSYSLEGQEGFTNVVILVAKTDDLKDLQLNKSPLKADIGWRKVDGSDYSWANFHYGSGASFNQISHPKSPFGVYSFGVSFANGYGSPASGNAPDCNTITCEKGEYCQMKAFVPTCEKTPVVKEGTCWAMGDPHYRTFDGRYYNFMGNCTYTMAKNCHIETNHPPFEVEAQNENRVGSTITFVGKVIIKVYEYTIVIMRSEFGLVRMNFTLWNLPIDLDNGKVTLFQSGMSVVVETDFGLVVQYDWQQHLVITVPGSFAGKMCGLCGNFNSRREDDLTDPSGAPVGSVTALGNSWRVPGVRGDAYCRDECVGQCESCSRDSLFAGLMDRWFCGVLTHVMDGPLRDCKAVIEPKVYHENCLFDVCMGVGKWNFFCDTLQVYADACQRAGIKVHDWRHIAHCPRPTCSENSHYEFCGTTCPATCENPHAPSKCKTNCVETCVCDDGFLLSGTTCVPAAQCGCMYYGHYVKSGASFWTNDHCTERCSCKPGNRKIDCEPASCRPGHVCKVEEGIRACRPMTHATCIAYGDPHYKTFDGHTYSFQGTCGYQLAGVCTDKDMPVTLVWDPFRVIVQNDGLGKRVGSSTKSVEVKVYGNSIVLNKAQKGSVLINSLLANLPVTLNQGNVTINLVGDFAEISTDFGLTVSYDWHTAVFVTVPSSYAGAMCGLCGNYNLKSTDDLLLKDGRQAATAEEMGRSWKVSEVPGCVDGCKDENHCPVCETTQKEKFEANSFCGLIQDPKGPFRRCHAVVPPSSLAKDCVDDVCHNNGDRHSCCDSLHLYTILCQQAGVEVDQWRTSDFCPKSDFNHPENSHYEHCASACQATCGTDSPPAGCKNRCQEGWVCNDGFILSGDVCVPIGKCGCTYQDKYYKLGQVFYPGEACKEECVCDGTVQCKKSSCGPNERCEVKRGVRSCQPFGKGVCSISGDPHYNTFDNSTYDFQGTCTYTAAEACNLQSSGLTGFSVAVENERWYAMSTNPKVSVAKLVSVTVYDNTLILRENQIGMIMLNGIMTTIPLNINNKQVQVYQDGNNYVILTDFGLRVTYDMIYHVTVTVPGNYRGHTCGLCGNFNGDKTDDYRLPGGKVTKDLLTFGEAWKVAVPGVVCEDGCSGDLCPKCDASKKEAYEKDCQVIADPRGPFAACHSVIDPASYYRDCVYDTCMSTGARMVLCSSIAAYMMTCQDFGVKIQNWRTPAFCPLPCPANSHYQICAVNCAEQCPGLSEMIDCPNNCAEGCTCDDGFYSNGTGCVSWDTCSCYVNGRTYKVGESVYQDDCQHLCTCTVSGQLTCVATECKSAERCQIQNGALGCYPQRCVLEVEGSFTLFSGVTGIIPVMATYELLEVIDESAIADWFRVVATLQECQLTGSKNVVGIYAFFSDLVVIITDKQETWVNGKKVTLPWQLSNAVSVDVLGKTVIMEKKGAFRLSYNWSLEVSVTVSNAMAYKVGGACGTLSSIRGHLLVSEETMQEYMAPFAAQDFPSW